MSVKKIAVIGAGNGGHAMAAHKTLDGFEVNLFDLPRFADNVRQVLDTGQITVEWSERKETVKLHHYAGLDARDYNLGETLEECHNRVLNTSMDAAFGAESIEAGIQMKGPTSMQDRYVTEDVPYGLVLLSKLGQLLDIATPICDAIINLSGAINRADYWAEGRGVDELGLGGMGAEQLKTFLETGD